MNFVTYTRGGKQAAGLWLDGNKVLDLAAAAKQAGVTVDMSSMEAIINGGAASLAAIRKLAGTTGAAVLAASEVKLIAPIPHPAKNVFCIGRNYLDHVEEGHRARGEKVSVPQVPQIFTKPPTSVVGPDATVRLDPKLTQKFDYEVELGLVIGKTGRDIKPEDALDHIFGYTIINDVTARDLQNAHGQWFKGKGLDESFPMGPWIVERADIADFRALELVMTVNGEERQRAKVSAMIFDIPTIIASLSAGLTLEAGDVIASGTPAGVGFAMDPPRFLKGGDVMVCTISQIGSLTNTIKEV